MTDEQRKARIHHHMYTTNEGIAEHAERIVKLEELCSDMWRLLHHWLFEAGEVPYDELKAVADRMDELGIQRGQ
jgi:hypothetical protein